MNDNVEITADYPNIYKAALENIKANDITIIPVGELTAFYDFLIICTARSSRHAYSIAESVRQQLKSKQIYEININKQQNQDWIILDYGDIIVHIMLSEAREFYALEKLWQHTEESRSYTKA